MAQINWYPGHMARARRLLEAQLKTVDAVVEICDARAPVSTRNPELIRLASGKPRILVLNKSDLASDPISEQWLAHYKKAGIPALKFNAARARTRELLARMDEAARPAVERMKRRGVNKTVRMMVVGIPNVGKSSLINRLAGKNVALAQDRPGVTRANRWVRVSAGLELLDTPGLLWPKLTDQRGAKVLAFLGSIRDEISDTQSLAGELLSWLVALSPQIVEDRFHLPAGFEKAASEELLEMACAGRGWLLPGGRWDVERGAQLVLDEFRAGRVGRFTLERPVR